MSSKTYLFETAMSNALDVQITYCISDQDIKQFLSEQELFVGGGEPWNKGLPKEEQPKYGMKHSEDTKCKMSEAAKGRPKSKEHRKKLSEYNLANGVKPPSRKGIKYEEGSNLKRKGNERTPAQIAASKRHSERMRGRTPWNKGKTTI